MRRTLHWLTATASLLSFRASPSPAQPERTLSRPVASFPEPFSGIVAIRELRDGRVLVSDDIDRTVTLIDAQFSRGASITKQGRGPTELLNPARLYAGIGDTTLVFDEGNVRYLKISPDGRPVATWRPRRRGDREGDLAANVFAAAWYADTAGRLYFLESLGPVGMPPAPEYEFQLGIVRVSSRTGRVDTVATLTGHHIGVGPPKPPMGTAARHPLAPQDAWTVDDAGTITIVRHADYHTERIRADGRRQVLSPIPFTRVRVGDAERRAESARHREMLANARAVMLVNTGPGQPLTEVKVKPRGGGFAVEPIEFWPEFAPPFRSTRLSVLAGPAGQVWVERIEPGTPEGLLYDVIDAAGRVVSRVRVPRATRVVGLSARWVYTATRDADDLVTLARHPLPSQASERP